MLFHSTRGQAPKVDFKTAVFSGLAPDGGLYMPDHWPQFDVGEMKNASYLTVAHHIIKAFTGNCLSDDKLTSILEKAYSSFPEADIIPQTKLEDNLYLMELFHGPSLSFKDVALQFIGALFDGLMTGGEAPVTILGATSGDTGSAAITAFAGKQNCRIVMLHPHGRISQVQRLQMTTVLADNVLNVAVDGDFDQCQGLVKKLMADGVFNQTHALTTVNSINWSRIAAQSVYYAYFSMKYATSSHKAVNFIVPSGNFGNAFSAHVARRMGFPVGTVHAATNANDGLTKLINDGTFTPQKTKATLSPAMDIQWASNYERLLFDLAGGGSDDLSAYINAYTNNQSFQMSDKLKDKVGNYFSSQTVSEEQTENMILAANKNWNIEIDPHTAVGLSVATSVSNMDDIFISLATAHPCKFPETYEKTTGTKPKTPASIDSLWNKPEKFKECAANADDLKALINERLNP